MTERMFNITADSALAHGTPPSPLEVLTFYQFRPLADPAAARSALLPLMRALHVRGTVTLAPEGVNATIAGAPSALARVMAEIATLTGAPVTNARRSMAAAPPFARSKVKVKRELISLGVPTQPAVCVGEYVAPADWNALISAEDVVTIDTRNRYEFALGHFVGAINPETRNFKEMVDFTERARASWAGKRIAMYCTGGIRCEKYSAYLVAQGLGPVFHLRGGILAYLEAVPPAQSLWQGECFVFDERVSLGHGLTQAIGQAA